MAVTIKELSAHCGLSISTVSKALNGYPDISEETKQQVRRAAQLMGYQPNAQARSLKLGRTFNLGVLYSDDTESGFTHSYFAPVLQAFKQEAERRGYDITFITHHMGQRDMTYLEHCRYRNVDGVCIVCCHFQDDEVQKLIYSNLPVVTIDHVFHDVACVQSQNKEGMALLTRYAIEQGHRRIAYLYGDSVSVTDVRRISFLRTMREAGLDVPDEYLAQAVYHDPAATREAALRLLAVSPRPTCILMPDDYAAMGGMEAITSSGLRIPQDVSVGGFDGVRLLQMCRPCLTTVAQDTQRIGQEAARQLVHLIERPNTTYHEVVPIPCKLIQGETIAPPQDP